MSFSSACGEGGLAAAGWTIEAESWRLRVGGRGDTHEVLLKVRRGIEGDRLRGMIRVLDDHCWHVNGRWWIDNPSSLRFRGGEKKLLLYQLEKSRLRHDL